MDLNMLCRICAKEDRLCIQVFGPEGKKQHVAKKISLCLPIVVTESDDFPKQICLNCLSNLDTCYEMYTQCLQAQSIIKNLMLVNVQSRGDVVKVYSTQELLNIMNELREKLSDKRPAMRLGNTVFTVQDTNSQTEVSSNNEQRAKKRKQEETAKTGGRGMMYPVAPVGQQYMLMPSATMPPTVMIPSPVPHGQFAIAPVPAIPTFPIAVPQTSVSTAPAVVTNTAVVAPIVTKSSAAPTTNKAIVQARSTAEVAAGSTAQAQVTSIQAAIQAFQNTSVQPTVSSQVNSAMSNTTSSSSVTEPQRASVQPMPLPEIVSLQNSIPVTSNEVANNQEQSPSEILSLITSSTPATAVITKTSPRSSPNNLQESSPQKPQSSSFMVNINEGGEDDDDDDEYAADDPDPLQDDSEEEEQDTDAGNKSAVENSATARSPDTSNKDREEPNAVVEELSSDGSFSGGQINSHKCPYCNKYFPEDVIFHHKKLHFRQKFFSCITCNKNFRTEAGLESHRCE